MKATREEFDRRTRGERRPGGSAETSLAIAEKDVHVIPVAGRDAKVEDLVVVDVPELDVSRACSQAGLDCRGPRQNDQYRPRAAQSPGELSKWPVTISR